MLVVNVQKVLVVASHELFKSVNLALSKAKLIKMEEEMETMVKEIRKEKRRKSSRRSSLANEVFQMINVNATTNIEKQTEMLSERIKESSRMPARMKAMLKKSEEMVENSPWELLSAEQKEFLNKNDLKLEEVEAAYKSKHGELIQMYMQRMDENKKYLDNKKYCYLRHAMNEKPSFTAAVAMVENLNTIE